MRKIFILLTVACVLFISACNLNTLGNQDEGTSITETTASETTVEDTTQTEYITVLSPGDFYDIERNSIPGDEDVKQIKAGMRFSEAVKQIGYPHHGGYMSSKITPTWQTAEGHTAVMVLGRIDGAPPKRSGSATDVYEYYLNYGMVYRLNIYDSDTDDSIIWSTTLDESISIETTVSGD